jgi:CubicO group peptidase (beta-lactamase class C family)
MKVRSLIAAFAAVCMSGISLAETLTDVLQRTREAYRLPGMAAIAFRRTDILEQACTGVRCLDKPDAITPDDRFHLGSITKSMTCSLAALLIEEKRLSWDDTVEKWLGKSFRKIHQDYRAITLRQLCEHRGGLPGHTDDDLWKELWRRSRQHDAATNRRWYVGELLKRPPAQTPGTFLYSNSGYMTAGLMLEVITGETWEALIQKRLFDPLGMKQTGLGPAATAADPMAQPWPHIDGKPIAPGLAADNPAALGPAGTAHASMADIARYGQWHLHSGHGKAEPTLAPAAFDVLHQSRHFLKGQGGYALGWYEVPRPWAKGNAWNHNGTNTMNYAVIWLAPEQDLGIAVCCNEGQRNAQKALDDITSWLVRKYTARH